MFCACPIDASYFCFMSLSTIGFGDMVPGSYPRQSLYESSRNVTVWFCSFYIMSGMALTAMCFNILHDEIVHRLSHQSTEKQEPPAAVKASPSVDQLSTDPLTLTSWQFPSGNLCGHSDDICGSDNEIDFNEQQQQVDVTRDCKPILKLEDHHHHHVPIAAGVYVLPKVDEEVEENTEMWHDWSFDSWNYIRIL